MKLMSSLKKMDYGVVILNLSRYIKPGYKSESRFIFDYLILIIIFQVFI